METAAMPKKLSDDKPSTEHPMQSGREPPPLSEDLITQLQMAVNKARQKHTSQTLSSDHPELPSQKS
jgi:hypothetical protein